MSLRWRLAIALGLLAGVAVAVASLVAYVTTADRLAAQVDGSLDRAAAQLAAAPPGAGPFGPLGEPRPGAAVGVGSGPGMGLPGSGGSGAVMGPPGGGGLRGGAAALLDLVSVQQLDRSGAVVAAGELRLPVTARDRAIAAHEASTWLRTEQVGGIPYRVVTVATPRGALQLAEGLGQVDGTLVGLRWRLGLLAVIVIVVAAGVGWLVARRITAPLAALSGAADHVAGAGSVDAAGPAVAGALAAAAAGTDEVGRLARALRAMLAALARGREQQRQLVHDAGHELRTPLTSLRANVDLLRRHGMALPAESTARILADLDAELSELTTLVDEVVELATDSRVAEPVEPMRIDEVVTTVAERARARADRVVTVDAEPWTVVGSARSVERAVSNLVDNAIKFSPAGASVEIVTRPGSIRVRDHGPGFAESDIERAFDRFYRAEAARSLPGSGLGLAIVSQVAAAHGGSAAARNHPDGGAELWLWLPQSV
ncbi:MAG: HAMP domain-containing sensor histidine kinase [Actinomycetota bacterium]|nr:HAMP domain-containing sensor histidine kinase [Actinomycetota bacterium]